MTQTLIQNLQERGKFDQFTPVEFDAEEAVGELLDVGNCVKIFDAVVDYSATDELATTLKAMLSAYHNSVYALKKADRDASLADFVIFAKSFSIVAVNALEESVTA